MDAEGFRQDVERKPEVLRAAAAGWVENPWREVLGAPVRRVVFVGMGSSHFATSIAAVRLQAIGVSATAVLASSDLLPHVGADDVVVAVSAGGTSEETLHALRRYGQKCRVIAVTNTPGSAITQQADAVVLMSAEREVGGVACRSLQHTQALLLLLEEYLGRATLAMDVVLGQAADACEDLLARRDEWLPVAERVLGPDGTAFVAPAHRLSSAQQSALMLREGPRLPAIACETGDWSHIDVYLTKTTDYRMVLFGGSRWEAQLLRWCEQRGSTVLGIGPVPGVTSGIRYRHDEADLVRLLSEVTVAEVLAAQAWTSGALRTRS